MMMIFEDFQRGKGGRNVCAFWSVGGGGLMILFYLKGFMFWSLKCNIIPGQFGFARY